MKRMAMEEPEKENIKLPFLQRCRIQLFNQNLCKWWAWQFEVKHYGFYTLRLCPVGISIFFSNLFNYSVLGFCLYCTLDHTVGISWVDTMWAAKTSPAEAEKSSKWAYSRWIFIYSKTGILNLFSQENGWVIPLWLSKYHAGCILLPRYININI